MKPFLIVIVLLKIVFDCTCLYFIFKKAGVKPVNAFIPFVNIFYYFKMCRIPFYTIFIPGVNLIVLFFSTYNIVKAFKQKEYICWLAVLVPEIALAYLAFSKLPMPKQFSVVPTYLSTVAELTEINNKLDHQNFMEDEYLIIEEVGDALIDNNYSSENIADVVEQNLINDEMLFDDNSLIEEVSAIKVESPVDIPETLEYFDDPDDLSLAKSVDVLEKNLEINSDVKREDTADYKEYKGVLPTNEAIAFGGTEQNENTEVVKAKVEELKCVRCGSSLVGATNICPGCGAQI